MFYVRHSGGSRNPGVNKLDPGPGLNDFDAGFKPRRGDEFAIVAVRYFLRFPITGAVNNACNPDIVIIQAIHNTIRAV